MIEDLACLWINFSLDQNNVLASSKKRKACNIPEDKGRAPPINRQLKFLGFGRFFLTENQSRPEVPVLFLDVILTRSTLEQEAFIQSCRPAAMAIGVHKEPIFLGPKWQYVHQIKRLNSLFFANFPKSTKRNMSWIPVRRMGLLHFPLRLEFCCGKVAYSPFFKTPRDDAFQSSKLASDLGAFTRLVKLAG